VVHEPVVKVLTTQVGVTSCGLDLEDTVINAQQGHIERTTTQVEDQDVALTNGALGLQDSNSNTSRTDNT
jgi:hypothetical protein